MKIRGPRHCRDVPYQAKAFAMAPDGTQNNSLGWLKVMARSPGEAAKNFVLRYLLGLSFASGTLWHIALTRMPGGRPIARFEVEVSQRGIVSFMKIPELV